MSDTFQINNYETKYLNVLFKTGTLEFKESGSIQFCTRILLSRLLKTRILLADRAVSEDYRFIQAFQ